jgi:hypothetical protein
VMLITVAVLPFPNSFATPGQLVTTIFFIHVGLLTTSMAQLLAFQPPKKVGSAEAPQSALSKK